jgi:large subunit ribosomal protein L18e
MIGTPYLDTSIHSLRKAFSDNKAPIWRDTIKYLKRTRSNRVSVNVGKIAIISKKNDIVLVPGKVLGGGNLTHNITVGAYAFSNTARNKIIQSGGEAISIIEFVNRYPKGKKVVLIG